MNILFLCSGGSSCKSIMAKSILEPMDKQLHVFAAGILPISELDPLAVEAMAETEIQLEMEKFGLPDNVINEQFDYLITLCDGTMEEYKNLQLRYHHKLHLSFSKAEIPVETNKNQLDFFRNLRDEMKTELHYFYHRILQNKLHKNELS